jgi:hypothetical protein
MTGVSARISPASSAPASSARRPHWVRRRRSMGGTLADLGTPSPAGFLLPRAHSRHSSAAEMPGAQARQWETQKSIKNFTDYFYDSSRDICANFNGAAHLNAGCFKSTLIRSGETRYNPGPPRHSQTLLLMPGLRIGVGAIPGKTGKFRRESLKTTAKAKSFVSLWVKLSHLLRSFASDKLRGLLTGSP